MTNKKNQHPVKMWSFIVGFVFLVGSVWGVAEAVTKYDDRLDGKYAQIAQLNIHIMSFDKYVKNNKISRIQEKLFIIDFKISNGTATPLDKALKQRYIQDLKNINKGS